MNTKQLVGSALLFALLATGCSEEKPSATPVQIPAAENQAAEQGMNTFSGKLLEKIDAGGYTYVHIATNNTEIWAAGPVTNAKKGDSINFDGKMVMNNFHSKSLNRDFDTIYFVDAFNVNGKTPSPMLSSPHKRINSQGAAPIKTFAKAENGQRIDEILDHKNTFAGKTVKLRGQVSKSTLNILGKNWIHIRDSSSQQDLTITTDAISKVDDIVLVEGTLVLNKDYGYGYVYDVIVEDATVVVE